MHTCTGACNLLVAKLADLKQAATETKVFLLDLKVGMKAGADGADVRMSRTDGEGMGQERPEIINCRSYSSNNYLSSLSLLTLCTVSKAKIRYFSVYSYE